MTKTHTMKAFDEELDDLRTLVATMATMVEEAFSGALLQADIDLARQVVERDFEIDALKRKLVDHAALVITRRQPMAGDLHEVLADFKIAEDLERIGDLAKTSPSVRQSSRPIPCRRTLRQMSNGWPGLHWPRSGWDSMPT